MKKNIYALMLLAAITLMGACTDYETYGELKEKERDAISQFIKDSAINVISETVFAAQGYTTDVSRNEYVHLNKSGVYMQIVNKGNGQPIEDGKSINLLCRFLEMNIKQNTVVYNKYSYVYKYDLMNVQRSGSVYTASFISGQMYDTYGGSVPAGWLVTFNYLNIGTSPANLAEVKLIVPHSQGHSTASSNVYPYYYEITFQRAR